MANGKVITGFSKPYVALYNVNDGTPTYSSGMPLARGVSVDVSPETGDSNDFYADNVLAESVGGVFTGADVTLTVDGLKETARKLVMGLPTAESITVGDKQYNVLHYDDRQSIPYVGVGFLVRYMETGIESYDAIVFRKGIFSPEGLSAETQEDSISFQTSELSVRIMRDDSANHGWKDQIENIPTEAEAENVLKSLLGVAV